MLRTAISSWVSKLGLYHRTLIYYTVKNNLRAAIRRTEGFIALLFEYS